jgi:hypothetical protein
MEADRTKKIAVIAVHGVGDQQPFDTAHRIGDLLQDLNIGQKPSERPPIAAVQLPVYYPFHEEVIRLDVRPAVVRPTSGKEPNEVTQPTDTRRALNTRGPFNAWVKSRLRAARDTTDDETWLEFTRGQLSGYRGDDPEDTYQTVRMEGRRAGKDGQPPIDVHVYELYWADLSRLKAGAFSIFTELYQLLFHLPSLGVHTINAAALHHRTADWRVFRQLQSWTAGILTVPILILNLLMLAFIAVVVAMNVLSFTPQTVVLGGSVIALFVGLLGWALWRTLGTKRIGIRIWLLPPLAIGLGAIALFFLQNERIADGLQTNTLLVQWLPWLVSTVVALVALFLVGLLVQIYNRRRPGALTWAALLVVLVFVAGVISAYIHATGDPSDSTINFWVREFELCDIALLFCWGGFTLLGLGTWIFGAIAVFRVRKQDKLAHRSRWTGLLMLALPAMAFLVVTVIGWAWLAISIGQSLPPTSYFPLWCGLYTDNCAAGAIPCLREIPAFVSHRLGLALQILLVFTGFSLIPAAWGLGPVVWKEVFPPEPTTQNRGEASTRLGRWLTLAFQGLTVSGVILYLATMFVLPALFSVSVLHPGLLGKLLEKRLLDGAALSGTGLLGLFLVRGRLRKLTLGFRPVLDILLDVDNWFREHPRDSNPKARIWGRYVSLLRYVANWREDSTDEHSGYDGIVIIAHSQGTVITADLLRYLKTESAENLGEYDRELKRLNRIPIWLFTMGSPLRQLYGLRFPQLYHWARHAITSPMANWNVPDLADDPQPRPSELLQVKLWVNCYRSGDYVGRFLWRTDACEYLWTEDCRGTPPSAPEQFNSTDGSGRLEFCIGAGAHTHYWDRTAGIVAAELDRLITSIS